VNDAAMNDVLPAPEERPELPQGRESVVMPLAMIDASERLRPVDEAEVAKIAASIEQAGQITPIEVAPRMDGSYRLVAGAHRMAALQKLGRTSAEVVIFEGDEDEQQLREIDENLHRHELNPLDQAVFLAKRQEVYLRLFPETKHGRNQHTGGNANSASPPPRSFAEDVAKRVGLATRTVQLALQRHRALHPAALALIRGTWIARKGSALDQLRDVPRNSQVRVAEELLSDAPARARNVRDARRKVLHETVEPKTVDLLKRAQAAVEALTPEQRVQLVGWMGNAGYLAQPKGKGS